MCKFTIESSELKKLMETVAPFNNKKNTMQFVIGCKDAGDNKLPSICHLVNGGSMVRKGFFAKKVENQDAGTVPYCSFNVKAADLISFANALLSYEEDVEFSIEESILTLRAGVQAEVTLSLTDEVEPLLPYTPKDSVLAMVLETSKFLDFARKGCFLNDDSDSRNIGDRVVFKASVNEGCALSGFSTNLYAFATATWSLEEENMMFKPPLLLLGLRQKESSLTGTDKKSLEDKIRKAEEEYRESNYTKFDMLKALAEEEGIEQKMFDFSLLHGTFNLVKGIVKGTKNFQVGVTDTYLIVLTKSTVGVFTLGSTIPSVYNNLSAFSGNEPVAKIVVDTQTVMKGLSLLSLNVPTSEVPLHITLGDKEMTLQVGGNTVSVTYIEKAGKCQNLSRYVNADLLREVVSHMDNGNLYFSFCEDEKVPIVVKNASIDGVSDSLAYVFAVATPNEDEGTAANVDSDTE